MSVLVFLVSRVMRDFLTGIIKNLIQLTSSITYPFSQKTWCKLYNTKRTNPAYLHAGLYLGVFACVGLYLGVFLCVGTGGCMAGRVFLGRGCLNIGLSILPSKDCAGGKGVGCWVGMSRFWERILTEVYLFDAWASMIVWIIE